MKRIPGNKMIGGGYNKDSKNPWPPGTRCVVRIVCNGAPATTSDHIIPIKEGGTDDPANLQPSCGPCNSAKGDTRSERRRRLG